ncbi:hypothetical protein VP01_1156g4 [Puccinia sorghi]|uniref:Uncharacterized protein n=1 Tax=Puccinia sorghi TaxID=27349 RepID=A0A0L6VRV4_9BASI|nr:hypothetical protein VP01_1156g4 [Puccinia sorghi]
MGKQGGAGEQGAGGKREVGKVRGQQQREMSVVFHLGYNAKSTWQRGCTKTGKLCFSRRLGPVIRYWERWKNNYVRKKMRGRWEVGRKSDTNPKEEAMIKQKKKIEPGAGLKKSMQKTFRQPWPSHLHLKIGLANTTNGLTWHVRNCCQPGTNGISVGHRGPYAMLPSENLVGGKKAPESDSRTNGSDELDPEEWNTIIIYMKKSYVCHLLNAKYNQHTPVYLDPADPTHHILLTVNACQTWAKSMVCLRLASAMQHSQLCCWWQRNLPNNPLTRSHTKHQSPPPPSNKSHIKGYIDFLGIHKREHTINICLINEFHPHQVFKLSGLVRSEVKALDLTLSLGTMLFDNIAKYKCALANRKN